MDDDEIKEKTAAGAHSFTDALDSMNERALAAILSFKNYFIVIHLALVNPKYPIPYNSGTRVSAINLLFIIIIISL